MINPQEIEQLEIKCDKAEKNLKWAAPFSFLFAMAGILFRRSNADPDTLTVCLIFIALIAGISWMFRQLWVLQTLARKIVIAKLELPGSTMNPRDLRQLAYTTIKSQRIAARPLHYRLAFAYLSMSLLVACCALMFISTPPQPNAWSLPLGLTVILILFGTPVVLIARAKNWLHPDEVTILKLAAK